MEPKEQIRNAIDVVDLVGEYLQLKKAGQGSFKALCPFHGEKTPSFYVHRSKQIWHCFGCDKGGDIFTFIMDMEGVEFPEALRMLAKKAGVELPQYERRDASRTDHLKAINAFAQKVYERYLQTAQGKGARAYLEGRGITEELQMRFGLGYAPDAWTALIDAARQKGISEADWQAAGLALPSKRGNRIDRFRHRLMIPLRDHHGDTVGFTGRVLRKDDTPKYMNSPQTDIYDKSALVYGLDIAKAAIKSAGEVILVEGNLDVIASHKADVKNVVAISGTALTERHIQMLKRYTTRFVFCFDADDAGFNAAMRGMHLSRGLGMDVRVVAIPSGAGKDPDEIVQKDPQAWRALVEAHADQMTYLFNRLVAPIDRKDVTTKKRAGAVFLEELAASKDTIEREHWLKRLSEALDVPLQELRKSLGSGPDNGQRKGNAIQQTPQKHQSLEDIFLAHSINDTNAFALAASRIAPSNLSEPLAHALYTLALSLYHDANTSNESFFEAVRQEASKHSQELSGYFARCAILLDLENSPPNANDDTRFSQILTRLEDRVRNSKRQDILFALREAERVGDMAQVEALTRQYQSML
ncbi:DNA primase [Candidatus Uhrbacteria bacterium RIFCSPLOWO2_01_FULL_53_9]|uniref:DNA primase n=2 Tax=Candidatus Uhriibacteriota TaxID=1752732 RepID=A0A1F7UYC2_9BACT|nr:MAG: DNA primase [Candidatus Uhrbacteria bacterium RIFCSPHIGHO2_02_FULL_53_13]OGL82748.1 MAG: DNA primase [Candidatus Uhrbacteria bacterium RIFCSPLOWO2_01_FULL_53_9]